MVPLFLDINKGQLRRKKVQPYPPKRLQALLNLSIQFSCLSLRSLFSHFPFFIQSFLQQFGPWWSRNSQGLPPVYVTELGLPSPNYVKACLLTTSNEITQKPIISIETNISITNQIANIMDRPKAKKLSFSYHNL